MLLPVAIVSQALLIIRARTGHVEAWVEDTALVTSKTCSLNRNQMDNINPPLVYFYVIA